MQTRQETVYYARILSVVAATIVSLACGSNYVFSAWGPQFAARMRLSSTESNLIATFGNLGMYTSGIPVGLMTDRKGPKPGVLGGSVLTGLGYYMMYKAFAWGPGSVPLPLLCIFMFLTGMGGCAAFSGAIKTSAMNWPQHRGTATAFPLAAFGLSAFFFASLSTALSSDGSDLLLLLAGGCFLLLFLPSFFLRIIPVGSGYRPVPQHSSDTSLTHKSQSNEPDGNDETASSRRVVPEIGEFYSETAKLPTSFVSLPVQTTGFLRRIDATSSNSASRRSAEISHRDVESIGDDDGDHGEVYDDNQYEIAHPGLNEHEREPYSSAESAHKSVYADVRGIYMLKYLDFYHYFLLLGILCGIGLMTINNIGNDAQALWRKWDPSVDEITIRRQQSVHVSIISLCSFAGRLASGIGSDLVVKRLHMSRVWCLLVSSLGFFLAQTVALGVENPNLLFLLSALNGLSYGVLFGCFPSAIAETFGVAGLSTNWGTLSTAPVLFSNVFNLMYGRIYDSHSTVGPPPEHRRDCGDGRFCYHEAYWSTLAASAAAAAVALWSIHHQYGVKKRIGWKDEGHLA